MLDQWMSFCVYLSTSMEQVQLQEGGVALVQCQMCEECQHEECMGTIEDRIEKSISEVYLQIMFKSFIPASGWNTTRSPLHLPQ